MAVKDLTRAFASTFWRRARSLSGAEQAVGRCTGGVEQGESYTVARRGVPVARLVPVLFAPADAPVAMLS